MSIVRIDRNRSTFCVYRTVGTWTSSCVHFPETETKKNNDIRRELKIFEVYPHHLQKIRLLYRSEIFGTSLAWHDRWTALSQMGAKVLQGNWRFRHFGCKRIPAMTWSRMKHIDVDTEPLLKYIQIFSASFWNVDSSGGASVIWDHLEFEKSPPKKVSFPYSIYLVKKLLVCPNIFMSLLLLARF